MTPAVVLPNKTHHRSAQPEPARSRHGTTQTNQFPGRPTHDLSVYFDQVGGRRIPIVFSLTTPVLKRNDSRPQKGYFRKNSRALMLFAPNNLCVITDKKRRRPPVAKRPETLRCPSGMPSDWSETRKVNRPRPCYFDATYYN